MTEGFPPPHGGFRAPRVPFDLRCVVLAGAGYLAVCGADWLLRRWWGGESPVAQLVSLIAGHLVGLGDAFRAAMEPLWGRAAHRMEWWKTLVTAASFLGIWSFFGAGMLRTAAMKLTRDEPIPLREALRFGGVNLLAFLLVPVLVLLFAAIFSGVNALFGLVMSFWGLGSTVLASFLFPLALLCSLLVVISLAGGLVGLPLMWAGIAVEQNGALEAISRAFSYVFARPFQFFFGYLLLFALMSVVLLLGSHFDDVVKTTLKLGIVRDALDDAISRPPGGVDVLQDNYLDAERVRREAEGISNLRNIRDVPWYDFLGFGWMWLLLNTFLVGFKGFALYLFLGGTVSLYLHLRRDVDGTDEGEIYPESEEDKPVAPQGTEPRWVKGEEPGGADVPAPDDPIDLPEPEPTAQVPAGDAPAKEEEAAEEEDADDEEDDAPPPPPGRSRPPRRNAPKRPTPRKKPRPED